MNHIGFKVNLPTYLGLKAEAKKRKITLAEICREVLTWYISIKSEPLVSAMKEMSREEFKKLYPDV